MEKGNSNELEKLVAMAEEVSETVNELHIKIANLRVMFMVSTIALYVAIGAAYFVFQPPQWLSNSPLAFYLSLGMLAVFLGLGSCFYIYKYTRNIRVYRHNLETEIEILHRLLEMVYEYKENIHDKELSYVEKAILDMKLQRIKYSSKW